LAYTDVKTVTFIYETFDLNKRLG